MSKLQSIIDQINTYTTLGKYIIWKEGCYYTGKIKVSIRWEKPEGGHVVLKSAYHANSLIPAAKQILSDKAQP